MTSSRPRNRCFEPMASVYTAVRRRGRHRAAVRAVRPQLTVIPGFFAINFAMNTGVAFSLLRQFPAVLTVLGGGIFAPRIAGILVLASFRGSAAPGAILCRDASRVRDP